MPWEKPGASAEMMQEDSMQCRAQARLAAPAIRQADRPTETTPSPMESRDEQLEAYYSQAFRKCMLDRGYSAKRL